jgi:hypothetical protein
MQQERSGRAPVLRPFTNGMRSPVIAPVVRGLLGIPLFLFATSTATAFAWTIDPPLTAAILGANYWASVALALWAAREHWWANGRVSISVALAFAPITTAATFLHFGAFHTDSSGFTLFITWFWIVAYAIYPLQLLWMLRKQLMTPGGDPPRTRPLPGWLRTTFVAQGVVLVPLGAVMFVAPSVISPGWPWTTETGGPIAALSMQALSAWVLAFGILAAHCARENDVNRVRAALLAYPVMVVLHLIALLRYGDVVVWDRPGSYLYVAYLATSAAIAVYGIRNWRRPPEPKWIEVDEDEAEFTG